MKRMYPCVEINLKKITHNTQKIKALCDKNGIELIGVSKVFCADLPIVEAMIFGGINGIGDSRVQNLKKLANKNCKKMLLRIPMESNIEDVVAFSDISLNSELKTINMINEEASRQNKIHDIILMIDLGDLREGILIGDIDKVIKEILKNKNINLYGLGTNLTCYGGVIPDEDNLGKLVSVKHEIETKYRINIPVISGGNSSSLYLVIENNMPSEINQLRIGEAIVLGRETSYGKKVPGCYNDCFILQGEIVEIKEKPSVPTGKIGMDAFGKTPVFKDIGIRKRAILAIGRQDINVDGLLPSDKKLNILGGSSDHLIVDITDSTCDYGVGDVINFTMNYGCLLRAMTSPYVNKYYENNLTPIQK